MEEVNWDERYKGDCDARPWDIGTPAKELTEFYRRLEAKPQRALEIGCGTGTNALWLAQQGVKVTALDLSPTAIAEAKKQAQAAQLSNLDYRVADICTEAPVPAHTIDVVFDRGVYHVISAEKRPIFVQRVYDALVKDGWWLCIAGSADEQKPEDKGPPRLSATTLIESVEAKFLVHKLTATHFELPDGSKYAAWKLLMRKR